MIKKRSLIALLFSSVFFSLPAQEQKYLDSLKTLLAKASTDSAKVVLLNKMSFRMGTVDPEQAYRYGKEAVEIAKKNGFKKALAHAYNNMGIIHDQRGESDSALMYYNISLEMSRAQKNVRLEASTLSNIGFIYWSQGLFDKALDHTLKSLAYFDTCSDYVSRANAIEHVAMIYYDLKDTKNSIKYHRQAIQVYGNISDKSYLANVYCNLALNYLETSKDSMIFYLKKAEAIFLEYNESWGLGHVYNNIGGVYLEMEKPDQAIEYLEKARKVRAGINDERGMVSTYLTLASSWLLKGNARLAKSITDTAVAMCLKMDMKESLADAYRNYVLAYSRLGVHDSVSKYLTKETAIRDSLYSNEKTEAIAEMQTKYDTEKKDLELAKNKAELKWSEEEREKKNLIIVLVITLLIAAAVSSVFVYRKKVVEQKAALDAERASQKELRAKAIIEAEEKERVRIAKDLHDGVGQLLSAAKLNLSSLESNMELKDPVKHSAFKNAVDLLDDSVKEVRMVSHNMMPNVLLKLGLASAVREFITKIQSMPDLKVNLEIVGMNERMQPETENILYRVIQEVVSNIIRHAGASELSLQLIRHERELTILVEDNGVGFDSSKINEFQGIGLKNIISRIEFLNGRVNFDSTPGKGTTVTIEVPLEPGKVS